MAATWYLGPAGDLRALICPEVNIDLTQERFGGVSQGLSGARFMDVTGHKQKITFDFHLLDQTEYMWYEAMHLRLLPGPFRLLNPLKKNRLTPESSMAKWGSGTAVGIAVSSGTLSQVYDWPSGASYGTGTAGKWSSRSSGSTTLRFDNFNKITVSAGEQITASVYLKASVAFAPNMVIDWWDRTSQLSSTSSYTPAVTTSWQRFNITATAPAGTTRAQFALYTSNTTSDLYVAGAQFEAAATPTAWEIGGGAPVVFVDQMTTTSPRYPLRNVSMTLLEV